MNVISDDIQARGHDQVHKLPVHWTQGLLFAYNCRHCETTTSFTLQGENMLLQNQQHNRFMRACHRKEEVWGIEECRVVRGIDFGGVLPPENTKKQGINVHTTR